MERANLVIVVHTLVDCELRSQFSDLAQTRAVPDIDLMGPLLEHLSAALGEQPAGRPGCYESLSGEWTLINAADTFLAICDVSA